MLLLTFVLLALPMSVSAATNNEWTGTNFDYLTPTEDGFTIAAGGSMAREIALWDGLLYEGKFSVEIKTSAITGGSGEMPGIFFVGKKRTAA